MMDRYRTVAVSLARQAGEIMRQNFKLGMTTEWKPDNSPVTITDTAINHLAIETIEGEFPDHSVVSEEAPLLNKSSRFVWVCDPVDGTLPYSNGIPISTFSLALTENGIVVLGVIYDPQQDRLFYAEKGGGATLNGKLIWVSPRAELSQSAVNAEGLRHGLWNLPRLIERAGARVTSFYSIVYSGGLVAAGQFSGLVLGSRNPWDAAAIKIIVEEAGGRATDLTGANQRYDIATNGLIASNGLVHDQLIRLVRQAQESN